MRTFLVWLVLASLLPGVVGAGLMLYREYRLRCDQLKAEAIQTARALSQTVDSYLLRAETIASTLSVSGSLAKGDYTAFHREAREVLALERLGVNIALLDDAGQQIINTLREPGTPLPKTGNPDLIRRVVETGKAEVSNLFMGGVSKQPIMVVAVPVTLKGKVRHVLVASIRPDRFTEMLLRQQLPEGRIAAVFDGQGTIAGRTLVPEKHVGRPATDKFRRQIEQAREGSFESINLDGTPVLVAYSISPATRWGVSIGIPYQALESELNQTLSIIGWGLAGVIGLGLGLAWFMGARIARSVRALGVPARALSMEKPAFTPPTHLREVEEVAHAMEEAARRLEKRAAELRCRESELAQRSAALRDSEKKLGFFTEHAPAPMAVFDQDVRYLAVSRRWAEDFGQREGSLVGQCHDDLLPDAQSPWRQAFRRGLAGEVLRGEVERIGRPDGSFRWIRWELWPWQNDAGAVGGVVVVLEDVTQETLVRQQLVDSEAYLRQLIATLPGMVWTAAPDGGLDFLSQQWLSYTGTTLESQLGAGFLETIHPDDQGRVCQLRRECLQRQTSFHCEYRLRRQDGTYGWVKSRGTPLLDPQGNVSRWLGVVIDIDDLKLAQEALHGSNALFRAVFEQAAVGIARVGLDGRWLQVNEGLCSIVGYGREQLLALCCHDITYPPDQERDRSVAECLISGHAASCTLEKRYVRKDGNLVWIRMAASLVRKSDGQPDYFVVVVEDIQSRREAEDALEAARQSHLRHLERQVAERTAALQEAHDHLEERVAERTEQVRRLAAEVTFAEERERQALARDLHDDLGQLLHIIKLKLGLLNRESLPPRGQALAEESSSLISSASRKVRSLTSQLSPPVLSTLGLPAALRWLSGEIEETYGLSVTCRAENLDCDLSTAQSAILFRAARELLINAAKHSGSPDASLDLARRKGSLVMTVTDRGNGAQVPEEALTATDGFGLASIRERISFLGGTTMVEMPPTGGLRVELQLTVEEMAAAEAQP